MRSLATFLPPPAALAVWAGIGLGFWTLPIPLAPHEGGTVTAADTPADTENSEKREALLPAARVNPADLAEMAARPLFQKGRRPQSSRPESPTEITEIAADAPEPVEPAQELEIRPPEIIVLGFMEDGSNARALVKSADEIAERWVSVGDTVGQWRIKSVNSDDVVIEAAGREFAIKIHR